MDWEEYKKLLDQKIADARHNYEFAKKMLKKAKASYDAAITEKQSFEKALGKKIGR